MTFTLTLLAFALSPLVRAVPQASSSIRVVWRYQDFKDGARVTLDAYTDDMKAQIIKDQVCVGASPLHQYTINTDNFAKTPLVISVDPDHGFAGDISLAGHDYTLSGGDYCYRVYDDESVFIDCTLPVSPGLISQTFTVEKEADCLRQGDRKTTLPPPHRGFFDHEETKTTSSSGIEPSMPTGNSTEPPSDLDKRVECFPLFGTQRIGDGDPHQNAWNIQLSENFQCGPTAGCTVGQTESQSYTIGFTSTLTLTTWINAGFAVSQTTVTGNNYMCNGAANDNICIWKTVMHTAYTVENWWDSTCGTHGVSNPIIVKSPNINNVGGGNYCVVGTCRGQGVGYWNNDGRAGGP